MKQNLVRSSIIISIVALITILIITNKNNSDLTSTTAHEQRYTAYTKTIQKFITLKPDNFTRVLMENEFSYIYFGRKTCSECRKFVPELAEIAEQQDITVHYINTEEPKTDTLKELLTTYNIEFVPTLMKITKNEYEIFEQDTKSLTDFLSGI